MRTRRTHTRTEHTTHESIRQSPIELPFLARKLCAAFERARAAIASEMACGSAAAFFMPLARHCTASDGRAALRWRADGRFSCVAHPLVSLAAQVAGSACVACQCLCRVLPRHRNGPSPKKDPFTRIWATQGDIERGARTSRAARSRGAMALLTSLSVIGWKVLLKASSQILVSSSSSSTPSKSDCVNSWAPSSRGLLPAVLLVVPLYVSAASSKRSNFDSWAPCSLPPALPLRVLLDLLKRPQPGLPRVDVPLLNLIGRLSLCRPFAAPSGECPNSYSGQRGGGTRSAAALDGGSFAYGWPNSNMPSFIVSHATSMLPALVCGVYSGAISYSGDPLINYLPRFTLLGALTRHTSDDAPLLRAQAKMNHAFLLTAWIILLSLSVRVDRHAAPPRDQIARGESSRHAPPLQSAHLPRHRR